MFLRRRRDVFQNANAAFNPFRLPVLAEPLETAAELLGTLAEGSDVLAESVLT